MCEKQKYILQKILFLQYLKMLVEFKQVLFISWKTCHFFKQ